MECKCCGTELTSDLKYCPCCGANNDDYVEIIQQTQKPIFNQPINRVPINNYQNNYQSNQQPPIVIYNQAPCQTQNYPTEGSGLAICALVFSILGGWLGLVLSIIGLCTYKEEKNRSICWIGLAIILVQIFVIVIILASIL